MYAENEIGLWQNYTVRDILKNQTYCGDTAQHRIEKISYKSKKLRKLPKNKWIIAENTHEPIIEREIYNMSQRSQSRILIKTKNFQKPLTYYNDFVIILIEVN
jgi:hypothetical protein